MWKHLMHEYFSFTKKERRGVFILLGLIAICLTVPFIYPYLIHNKTYDLPHYDQAISRLKIKQTDSTGKKYRDNYKNWDENNYTNYYEPSEKKYYTSSNAEVFYFDPNTLSSADWKRLGVRDKTIETIQKYLSKGGHFYKPEDIGNIWGLRKDDVERLLPYVRIENNKKEYAPNEPANFTNNTPYKKPSTQSIDINTADTAAFISLPGIGSKLAQRIVSFRDKLGGFYTVDQIKETYGLPDSVYMKIKPRLMLSTRDIKQLNINTATIDEMKSHPYLRYNLSNAIIQYKTQHGNYSSISDIKKIVIITDDIFNKLSPYLTIN